MLKTLARGSFERLCVIQRCYLHETSKKLDVKTVKEIQIPVPWGHIAGKWWGSSLAKPLVGLHGWQDNANTFDLLAPMLPEDISLLAIDSPGHGMSSPFPRGIPYRMTDQIFTLLHVLNHFSWDKISLLSHSMGAVQSFIFSSVYPEMVENLIFIDAIKPRSINPEKDVEALAKGIDSYLSVENLSDSAKPSYSYDEALQRLYDGMVGRSLTKESCNVLLERGLEKNEKDFTFKRDTAVRVARLGGWIHEHVLYMASCIKCNVLFIKADPGLVYEDLKSNMETLEAIKKSAASFEYHVVKGLHHVHLNNPERVAPIIVNFLKGGKGSSEIPTSSWEKISKKEDLNFL